MAQITTTGATHRDEDGLFGDDHQFELDGQLRDLHSTDTVEIHLIVSCS